MTSKGLFNTGVKKPVAPAPLPEKNALITEAQQSENKVVISKRSNTMMKDGVDYHAKIKMGIQNVGESGISYDVYLMDAKQVAKRAVKPTHNILADYEDAYGNLIKKIYFLNHKDYFIGREHFTDVLERYLLCAHKELNSYYKSNNIEMIHSTEGIIAYVYKLYLSLTSDTLGGQTALKVNVKSNPKLRFLRKFYIKMDKDEQDLILMFGEMEVSEYSGNRISINNERVVSGFLSLIFWEVGFEQLCSGLKAMEKYGKVYGCNDVNYGITRLFFSNLIRTKDAELAVKNTVKFLGSFYPKNNPFDEDVVRRTVDWFYQKNCNY